jgi:uncharacterized phiE125 gp8 family phage protein
MAALTIVTGPTLEPVTLAEIEDHLRISETSTGEEDTLLEGWITAARRYCEMVQNRAYLHQTWALVLDDFPRADWIDLPRSPLVSVTHLKYYGTGGTATTMTAANYIVDTYNEPGRLYLAYGEIWPTETLRPANGVEVQFLCGYGSVASAVPAEVKQAIKLIVGHMYERREATDIKEVIQVPLGADDLLWLNRVVPV